MAASSDLQFIGGEEMYKPLCRECFNEESLAKEMKEIKNLNNQSVSSNESSEENSPMKESDWVTMKIDDYKLVVFVNKYWHYKMKYT